MKAILISTRPQWVEKILNGEKTIEIRKRFPKDYVGWVYIYCTNNGGNFAYGKGNLALGFENGNKFWEQYRVNGKVVARFWCDKVEKIRSYLEPEQWYMTSDLGGSGLLRKSCLSFKELDDYLLSGNGYAIHINDLEIFDKPKELSEFKRVKWSKCGVKDKNGLYQCHKCPYAIHYGHGFGDCGYKRPLKAPQSWCYIEI